MRLVFRDQWALKVAPSSPWGQHFNLHLSWQEWLRHSPGDLTLRGHVVDSTYVYFFHWGLWESLLLLSGAGASCSKVAPESLLSVG